MLHVTGDLLPRSETFVQQRLVAGDFEPVALAWRHVPDGLEIPCEYSILPSRPEPAADARSMRARADQIAYRARRFADLVRAVAAADADVVHAHFGTVGAGLTRVCTTLGLPLVVSFYGFDVGTVHPGSPTHARYRTMFAHAAALTAEGPVLARRIIALGAPAARLKLLPLSLPPWALREPSPDPTPQGGPLRLIQVARFVEKKGVDTTLEAIAVARDLGANVALTLVGDGPDRAAVDARIERLGIAALVSRPGMVPHAELANYFARHDALIQPSRTARDGDTEGGHPTVLIEAQAQGLAVLSTTHGDIPTAVRHGVTGLLAAEGDARAVGENIARLALDRGELARLRAAARPWVLRRHDPALLTALRERIYRRVLAQARRGRSRN